MIILKYESIDSYRKELKEKGYIFVHINITYVLIKKKKLTASTSIKYFTDQDL